MIVKVAADHSAILERLGRVHKVLGPGVHFVAPFIDRVARRYSLAPQSALLDVQVISLDNVPLRLTGTATFRVLDARRVHENVADYAAAVPQLLRTALVDEAGKRSREALREEMRLFRHDVVEAANAGAEQLGLKVTDVTLEVAR